MEAHDRLRALERLYEVKYKLCMGIPQKKYVKK